MRVEDLKAFFGCRTDTELAQELEFPFPSTVTNWRHRRNGIVPELHARRLADKYRGRRRNGVSLTFDQSAYE